jgi:hypothetical protein
VARGIATVRVRTLGRSRGREVEISKGFPRRGAGLSGTSTFPFHVDISGTHLSPATGLPGCVDDKSDKTSRIAVHSMGHFKRPCFRPASHRMLGPSLSPKHVCLDHDVYHLGFFWFTLGCTGSLVKLVLNLVGKLCPPSLEWAQTLPRPQPFICR